MFTKTKKFRITDSDGQSYEVEEVNEKEDTLADETEPTEPEVRDEGNALTEEEIKALKSLASVADKLIALTTATVDEGSEELEDACEDGNECETSMSDEDEEKILKTDSKKSFGSLQKKTIDSSIDAEEQRQIEIANAWANRCKGGNK